MLSKKFSRRHFEILFFPRFCMKFAWNVKLCFLEKKKKRKRKRRRRKIKLSSAEFAEKVLRVLFWHDKAHFFSLCKHLENFVSSRIQGYSYVCYREKAENSGGHPRGVRSSETRTVVKMAVKTVSLEKESQSSRPTAPDGDLGRGRHFSSRLQKLCWIFNIQNHVIALYLALFWPFLCWRWI